MNIFGYAAIAGAVVGLGYLYGIMPTISAVTGGIVEAWRLRAAVGH